MCDHKTHVHLFYWTAFVSCVAPHIKRGMRFGEWALIKRDSKLISDLVPQGEKTQSRMVIAYPHLSTASMVTFHITYHVVMTADTDVTVKTHWALLKCYNLVLKAELEKQKCLKSDNEILTRLKTGSCSYSS